MKKPKIVDINPAVNNVKKGEEYYWCACGESKKQPFCDGSHRTTSFKPLPFKADEDGDAYLCMCKQTKNPPYCDGSHKSLDE